MRFILDTNIIIPAEPTAPGDIEAGTPVVASLLATLSKGNHTWLIHPGTLEDLERDKDSVRRDMRRTLLQKYNVLSAPPNFTPRVVDEFGYPEPGSNDHVDLRILSAIEADCADYLVTDDERLRKRARRVGLGERVVSAAEALGAVRALFPAVPVPPPLVRGIVAHQLDEADPIFDSLRKDYDGFDVWLRKCKREQRQVWIIPHEQSYAGLCIVKDETKTDLGLNGRVLKICTFKISDQYRGYRYGELLLKTVFDYLVSNRYDFTFVEVFPKQEELRALLGDFGFEAVGETLRGELVLSKKMRASEVEYPDMSPLDFNVKFGPSNISVRRADAFLAPIQPQYHRMLFPEAEAQLSFMTPSHSFGNSIRKAYLCHSKIRRVTPGALLLFYRSKDLKAVQAVCVVESTLVSQRATEIARFVGKRTVYNYSEIQAMADKPTLVVLFRLARILDTPWPLELLIRSGCIKGSPQSFATVPGEARAWLVQQLSA